MKPPATGPKMLDSPQTPLKRPCILARSCNVKMSPMMVMASGTSAPAPSPCTDRATMSCVIVCENPHARSEEHTSELQSQSNLVCRLLLEKKKKKKKTV